MSQEKEPTGRPDNEGANPDNTAPESIQMLATASLRPHPLNAKLYGDKLDPAFLEEVQQHGIITPLMVTTGNLIVSGHRRWQAASQLKLATVPARVINEVDPDEIERLLLAANVQREKSMESKLREFEHFLELEEKAARARQGQRTDLCATLREGSTGRAGAIAAGKVGMSDNSARHGLKILKALAERDETANAQDLEEVRRVLNERGVEPAYKRAVDLGWIAKPTPRTTNRTTIASPSRPPTTSPAENVQRPDPVAAACPPSPVAEPQGSQEAGVPAPNVVTPVPAAPEIQPPAQPTQPAPVTAPVATECVQLADGATLELPCDAVLTATQLKTGLSRLTPFGRKEKDGPSSAQRLAAIQRYYVGLAGAVNMIAQQGLDDDERVLMVGALEALAHTIETSTQG